METPAAEKLRKKLSSDQEVYGLWRTLESPSIAQKFRIACATDAKAKKQ